MISFLLNTLAIVWTLSVVLSILIICCGFIGLIDSQERRFRKMNGKKFFTKGVIITTVICLLIALSPDLFEFVGVDRLVFNKQGEYLRTVNAPCFMTQWTYNRLLAENDVRDSRVGDREVYPGNKTNVNFNLMVRFNVLSEDEIQEAIKEAVRRGCKEENAVGWLVNQEIEHAPSFKGALAKALAMKVKPLENWDRPELDEFEAAALFVPAIREAQEKLTPFGIKISAPKFWIIRRDMK